MKYYALVTRTEDIEPVIISVFLPDFGKIFKRQEDIEDCYSQAINYIKKQIKDDKKIPAPTSLHNLNFWATQFINFLDEQRLAHQQPCWEALEIELETKNSLFTRGLPLIGHLTNIFTVLCGGFITFMALRIASSTNGSDNNSSLNTLSVIGTILSSIISFIMYIYSGATEILESIGSGIDNSLYKIYNHGYKDTLQSNNPKDLDSSMRRKSVSILALGCITANALIVGVTSHQENTLLVDKYLELHPTLTPLEHQKQKEVLDWLVVLFILAGTYANLAFQGSFAIKFVEGVMNKLEKHDMETETITDNRLLLTNNSQGLFFQNNRISPAILNRYEPIHQEDGGTVSVDTENENFRMYNSLNL